MTPQPNERRPPSAADAVMVVALLVFMVGWIALWALVPDADTGEKAKDGASLLLAAIVFLPPLWAGSLIERIVDRG